MVHNLELYWGPYDGKVMEMTLIPTENGLRRPASVNMFGYIYNIDRATSHPDKTPQEGITHIGVYSGESS